MAALGRKLTFANDRFRPEADGQDCRQRTHKIEQTLTFLFSRRPLSAGRLQ